MTEKAMRQINQLPQRFLRLIEFAPNTGCWLWAGHVNQNGYGTTAIKEPALNRWITRYAHRVMYQLIAGPIPAGLDLDHLCRVRCCVNPEHLEPVTRRENVLRGDAPALAALLSRPKTHCMRGHQFTADNIYTSPDGGRKCRRCSREQQRAWKAEARAK